MDASKWTRVEELFAAALEMHGEERDAFLREQCGDDSELYDEVTSLLASDDSAHSMLDGGVLDVIAPEAEVSLVGKIVGSYHLIGKIGVGGMGVVYLAERADGQFEQKVALKLIKRGMDSEEILRRFHSERRILARLQHPNIARILDGGITDDGLPFFTMEYVDGDPVDVYCDNHRLSVERRLEIFETVCDAVRHAQRNLIVHRDLKPSNILVGADGTVKLLDFGIAKMLVDDDEGEEITRTGVRVMTPGYAAPEQVRGEPATTATDVYALGVILYELLSGQRPFSPIESTPNLHEKAVLTSNPDRPSTALYRPVTPQRQATTTTAESVSNARSTRPEQLRRKLSGDLDNICLKALRKEPERRYSSAEQLLDDVLRFRAGRPVSARPDTVGYRFRKFVQRNVGGVVTTVSILVGASTLVAYYTTRLSHERDRAQLEAVKAQSVSDFIVDLFRKADPAVSRGEELTVREILDQGLERIETEFDDQPEVKGQMLYVVGDVYYRLGRFAEAIELIRRSYDARVEALGERNPETIKSLALLADATRESGDHDGAEPLLRQALALSLEVLGPDDAQTGEAMNNLSILMSSWGRYEEAETYLLGAMAAWEKGTTHEDSMRVAMLYNNLALMHNERGDLAGSDSLFQIALSRQRKVFGNVHLEVATTLYNYGQLLRTSGYYKRAEEITRQGLEMDRKILGDEHPDVAFSLSSYAMMLQLRGDYEGAKKLIEEALALRRKAFGDNHADVGFSTNSLARIYHDMGQYAIAESLYTVSMEINKKYNGERHVSVAQRLNNLGWIAFDRGDYKLAESYHRQGLEMNLEAVGEDGSPIAANKMQLAHAVGMQGRYEEAFRLCDEAMEQVARKRHPNHPYVASSKLVKADLLRRRGDYDQALALCHEAIEILEKTYDEDHIRVGSAVLAMARVLEDKGDYVRAAVAFRRALDTLSAKLPGYVRPVGEAMIGLGEVLCASGDVREGSTYMGKGLRILERIVPESHPDLQRARQHYATCSSSP